MIKACKGPWEHRDVSGSSSGTRPGLEEAPREGRGVNAPGRKAGCVDLDQSNILGIATDRAKQKHCWSPEREASGPGRRGALGRADLEAGQGQRVGRKQGSW